MVQGLKLCPMTEFSPIRMVGFNVVLFCTNTCHAPKRAKMNSNNKFLSHNIFTWACSLLNMSITIQNSFKLKFQSTKLQNISKYHNYSLHLILK